MHSIHYRIFTRCGWLLFIFPASFPCATYEAVSKGQDPHPLPFHSDSLLFRLSGILVQDPRKMFSILHLGLVFFALLPYAFAAPPGVVLGSGNNAGTSAVSLDTVTSQLHRPAEFARVAYCSSESVTKFTCGEPCDAVRGIEILHIDGDQGAIPRCEFPPSQDQYHFPNADKSVLLIWRVLLCGCGCFWCSFHCCRLFNEFSGGGSWGYQPDKHSIPPQRRRSRICSSRFRPVP